MVSTFNACYYLEHEDSLDNGLWPLQEREAVTLKLSQYNSMQSRSGLTAAISMPHLVAWDILYATCTFVHRYTYIHI